jgi:ring-1,2-phenylacetyl-CoA epoxidase subunit PaaE
VAIKQVEGGQFSTFANHQLKKGDSLEAMAPLGHFTLPDHVEKGQHFVFFAAGSGITPVFSLLKTLLREHPETTCALVYGNRNAGSVIFREAIEGLKNKYVERFQIFHTLSRERMDNDLANGRLDEAKIHLLFDKLPDVYRGDAFYVCGPLDMIESVRQVLKERDVPAQRVHFELFNAPVRPKDAAQKPSDYYKKSHASILLDGRTFEVEVPEGMSILDAAQTVGADLPFACKGGVCCTCRARLIEGEVEMEVNFSLTEEETEAGYVLTCQSIPKTERVFINFDA